MSEYLPAGGTGAAFDRDFGTSRWQLDNLRLPSTAEISEHFRAAKEPRSRNTDVVQDGPVRRGAYLNAASVMSNASFATKAALHQFDTRPEGLIAEIALGPPNVAV